MGAADHNLVDEVKKAKMLRAGQVHNFVGWQGVRNAEMELAFLHQSAQGHIHEKMAEAWEEGNSNSGMHLKVETPLEQKVSVAEAVELMAAP